MHLVGCNKWKYTQGVQEYSAEEDNEARGVGNNRQLENITQWKASGWEVLARHYLGDDIRMRWEGHLVNIWTDQKVLDQIFFSFKQEGAWDQEWGVCDLGPPCACMNYCLTLRLLNQYEAWEFERKRTWLLFVVGLGI